MEVELDVRSEEHSWRSAAADWAAFCRETWSCQEDALFKDEPFAPADWERHSSWRRHCPEPFICLRVFRMLSIVEAWVLAVATGVALYASFAQPAGWPVAVSGKYIIVFQLTSFAVSLLLVFRTNAAYGRFWEARTACGRWLNCVRNSQRMLLSWSRPSELPLVHEYARWLAALTPAACAYLRRKDCYWAHCEGLLQPGELGWLQRCDNPPVKVLMVLSGLLARTSLDSIQRSAIEAELSAYDVALGALERITRQAVPKAYTRHTSRFIIVFLTFLPFALWEYLKWLVLPVSAVLTFLLLGIENIGIQIENPVRVLPLHSFCAGLKQAALSMVRHHYLVQQAIETGLEAAVATAAVGSPTAAARWDGKQFQPGEFGNALGQGLGQGQGQGIANGNGLVGRPPGRPLGVQPMPGMTRD